jgi:hypothetical protein
MTRTSKLLMALAGAGTAAIFPFACSGVLVPNDPAPGSNSHLGGSSSGDLTPTDEDAPSPTMTAPAVWPGPGDDGGCPPGSPLSCYVSSCPNGGHTTIAGKVYDPAGTVPLQNVIVYVPNDPTKLPSIAQGTLTCGTCDGLVTDFVAAAVTDQTGSFTLTDVPTGKNVPLVVEIGKWRRVMTVASTEDCKTTTLPSTGSGQARLPRSRKEGDMPQMALLTGGEDNLGCFLVRVGIDPTEFSAPQRGGRLDIYRGLATGILSGGLGMSGPGLSSGTAGDCTTTSCPLWASKQSLESYDMVLLGCQGDTFDATIDGGTDAGVSNVTTSGKLAMHDWLNEGGRLLATHFQYTWFQNGPADFQGVANWLGPSPGSGVCAHCSVDVSFANGEIFSNWLGGPAITLTAVGNSVSSVNSPATRWIYDTATGDPKALSFGTPVGGVLGDAGTPAQFCGKATFLDVHAGAAPSGDLPGSCAATDLTEQERAIEFLFFDLAACIPTNTPRPIKGIPHT